MKWIPVSERLPDEGDTVLITQYCSALDEYYVDTALYENGQWFVVNNMEVDSWDQELLLTIAWMPLPEPYQS